MKQTKMRFVIMALFLFCCVGYTMAQDAMIDITGTVTEKNNEPLIGVSVVVKGSRIGCSTDIDGNYTLSAPKGSTILFSYIGYNSVEKKAIEPVINVTMEENTTKLDEVVVVGYGVQKKSSVTGAISQVKSEDIENRTISNAQQALQGKTSGVQVIQTSGSPGASPTVRVRGYSSNVSSEPLYVVDGVRMGSISGIDPNDIASMEVLKDAASAAIYGAEAGNGVVLITTKKGKKGQGKITYDFQYASQSLAKVPRMLNSEQYINYMTEGGTFSRDFMLKNWDGVTNTSWSDVAFETGNRQKHNIAFTNGNELGNFYISLTYLDDNGIVTGNKDVYKRLTGTINGEYSVKPWLKLGTTNQIEKYNVSSVSSNNEYGSLLTSILQLDPLTPDIYAPDNLPVHMLNAINNGKHLLTDGNGNYYGVSKFFASEQYHPMIMRDKDVSKNSGFNVNGSIYGDFKPFKGFVFTSRFGYRFSGTRSSSVSLPFYGNSTQSTDYVGMNSSSSTTIYYQWENFANYNRTFGDHSVNAMLGMSYQESSYQYVNGSLSANNEDALIKNDPLFWYLNYGAASATKGVGGEKTRSS